MQRRGGRVRGGARWARGMQEPVSTFSCRGGERELGTAADVCFGPPNILDYHTRINTRTQTHDCAHYHTAITHMHAHSPPPTCCMSPSSASSASISPGVSYT